MPNAFTEEECDYLQEEGQKAFEAHSIDGFHFGEDPSKRSSQISWVNDSYAMSILECAMLDANDNAGWLFDLKEPEQIQYTLYQKDDGYDWHTDGHQDVYAAKTLVQTAVNPMPLNQTTNPRLAGLVRKLSLTVNLSQPEDYEGGTLELYFHNQTHVIDEYPRGSAIVFPSFIHHRISPILKGTRKSAVMWFNGLPLR